MKLKYSAVQSVCNLLLYTVTLSTSEEGKNVYCVFVIFSVINLAVISQCMRLIGIWAAERAYLGSA